MRISRRGFFGVAGSYAATVALLGLTELVPTRGLARPPGALAEEQFLQTCIRCGACADACPIQQVKRADLSCGFREIWTPRLLGHCMVFKGLDNLHQIQVVEDHDLASSNVLFARDWKLNVRDKGQAEKCFKCVEICPSGALRDVAPEQIRIGTAVVNKDLCKAWHVYSCTHDCAEVCPVDAITLAQGPIVDENKCVGCNLCNFVCVSETTPRAIGVQTLEVTS